MTEEDWAPDTTPSVNVREVASDAWDGIRSAGRAIGGFFRSDLPDSEWPPTADGDDGGVEGSVPFAPFPGETSRPAPSSGGRDSKPTGPAPADPTFVDEPGDA